MKKVLLIIFVLAVAFALSSSVSLAKNDKPECTTIQSGELYGSDGNLLTTGFDQWGYNYQGHMFRGGYCDSYRDAAWCQPYKDVKLIMKWNSGWLDNKDCDGDDLLDRHYGFPSYIGSGAWLTNHQSGEYTEWSIVGDWVLEFDYLGTLYIHDMIVTDNTFVGTGGYPAEGPYTTTWTVEGTLDGDNVEMTISYDNSTYYVDVVGVIAEDGSMSGTWSNPTQLGNWKSTTGEAIATVCGWNYFVKIVAAPADAYAEAGFWYTADGTEIGPVIWGSFATIMTVENDTCAGVHGMQYLSPDHSGFGGW